MTTVLLAIGIFLASTGALALGVLMGRPGIRRGCAAATSSLGGSCSCAGGGCRASCRDSGEPT